MVETSRAGTFSGRVGVLFGTQVFGAAVGIANGILLARLLGPAAKGDYYLLILVPSTVMVLVQLGLPQAFSYFSARGETLGMVGKSLVLTVGLSSAACLGVLALLPLLRDAFLHGIGIGQVLFAFLALPLALNATFATGIVMGRQAVRWYAAVNIAYPIATTFLLVAILGGLGPSVTGAIAVYLVASLIQSAGFTIGAKRVSAANAGARRVSYSELLRYGLPFYPASITGFFSYRIDAYLIAWLITDAAAPLGYYSMAVGLAELVFFFPSAVSTLFFPHVAGSPREDSDRQVAVVSRVTLLVSGTVAILLIPAAAAMIWILLPAFGPSIPAFLVLLPGVVALSVAKVVGGYVAGIGRPGISSYVSVGSFAVNVVANLILIPRFGIIGASAASLVSYSLSALWLTAIAARLTRTPLTGFWIPRAGDVRFTVATIVGLVRRLRDGRAASRDDRGVRIEP
ncbi:MAG: polysaccharide biosynthesis C-terminal domain-containing protein [Chloroflexota bacterium]